MLVRGRGHQRGGVPRATSPTLSHGTGNGRGGTRTSEAPKTPNGFHRHLSGAQDREQLAESHSHLDNHKRSIEASPGTAAIQ